MPGREDFAIIRARLLADERAHRAAVELVTAGLAVEATALATVVGLVAEIGVWAATNTDDGVLPGDGTAVVSAATMTPRTVAQAVVVALVKAELLRPRTDGVYLVGFKDCYRPLIEKRETDRFRKAEKRGRSRGHPTDVAPTSEGRPEDVQRRSERRPSVPYRTGPDRKAGPGTGGVVDAPASSVAPGGASSAGVPGEEPWRAEMAALVAARKAARAPTPEPAEPPTAYTPLDPEDFEKRRAKAIAALNGNAHSLPSDAPPVALDGADHATARPDNPNAEKVA